MFEIKDKTASGSLKEGSGGNQCYSSNDQLPMSLLQGILFIFCFISFHYNYTVSKTIFNHAFMIKYYLDEFKNGRIKTVSFGTKPDPDTNLKRWKIKKQLRPIPVKVFHMNSV